MSLRLPTGGFREPLQAVITIPSAESTGNESLTDQDV